MAITSRLLGLLPDGREAKLFTLQGPGGMQAEITNYGGTVTSLLVPDKAGHLADVVLGLPSWEEWIVNPAYMNCIVGRTCNRIRGARFTIDGTEYRVTANSGTFQLHGGKHGFHHKLWEAIAEQDADGDFLSLHYLSADGEEGFPGNLQVHAMYRISKTGDFSLEITAETDKPTPVNLTNHSYFNLSGEGSGTIYNTLLRIDADQITETDEESIPTGRLLDVSGTPYDFREYHTVGERIGAIYKGYDQNFVLRSQDGTLAPAAWAKDPVSGRTLEILTTEPGVQLYTSNWFGGSMTGRCGKPHEDHTAFCLETQHYPDSMNQPGFPDVILRPGRKYYTKTVWRFGNR
jgi:aldose 1-epimerase